MSESKIQIKVGIVEFSGEGQQEWLASQLDKILEKVPELVKMELSAPPIPGGNNHPSIKHEEVSQNQKNTSLPTLSIWLREKGATSIQTKKFLATAAHIQLSGKKRVNTGDVNAALRNANQTKLNNASDSLNQNVTKGFCEKEGKDFYVTDHGMQELNISQ